MNNLTRADFTSLMNDVRRVGIVVFHAVWCAPSKLQVAFLDHLASTFEGRSVFIGCVDVDAEPELADEYNVHTLPATLVIGRGEVVEQLFGYQAEDFLKAYLEQLLETIHAPNSTSISAS